jgi:hypothetical protein
VVVSFELDLQDPKVILHFDEPVFTGAVESQSMTLTQFADGTGERVVLDSAAILSGLPFIGDQSGFELTPSNVLAIKALTGLATSASTVFAQIAVGFAQDANAIGNAVQSGVLCSKFTRDSGAPTLTSFAQYDPNTGEILIYYDEPVALDSVDRSALFLRSSGTGGAQRTVLKSDASITYSDAAAKLGLSIGLSAVQIQELALADFYSSRDNTWIEVTPGFITDTSGNAQTGVVVQAASYGNVAFVELDSFVLNLQSGTLVLTMSGVIEDGSLNANFITLLSSDAAGGSKLSLSEETTILGIEGFAVTLNLTWTDLNLIKSNRALAVSTASTWIAMDSSAFDDSLQRPVVAIEQADPLAATNLVPDATPPAIRRFDFDLSTGKLSFYFSETVDLLTFNSSCLVLTGVATNPGERFFISGGALSPTDTGASCELVLSNTQLDSLKRLRNIGVSQDTTFVSTTSSLVDDMSGIALPAVAEDDAIQATSFGDDGDAPSLDRFELDMTNGTATISFGETIDPLHVNLSLMYLQPNNSPSSTSAFQGTFTYMPPSTLVVTFALDYLNGVKADTGLATEAQDTFLTLTGGAVRDMRGNLVAQVTRPVDAFVSDTKSPRL